jgi:HK97 gp10 family phage protein
MADVVIKIDGLNKLIKNFGSSNPVVIKELGGAIIKSTLKVQAEAKRIVPVDTGNLQKQIKVFKSLSGKSLSGTISAQTPYAAYIEYGQPIGTGPHGGPRPYMRPGAEKSTNAITQFFQDAADAITKALTK